MPSVSPRVFISYSHDSDRHKTWVLEFASKLRVKGVDAVLDQWDLKPGKDVSLFMEEQLSVCDFAILVCTKRYVEKANAGKGGVGYERMIVSSELIKDIDAGKFIPIIREHGDNNVPKFIGTKYWLDFSNDEYFESILDDLLRHIFGAEISTKPALGEAPNFDLKNSNQTKSVARTKTGLSVEAFEVYQGLIQLYDAGADNGWDPKGLMRHHNFGRVTIDAAVSELTAAGYASYSDMEEVVWLTSSGMTYAKKIGIV